MLPIHVEVWMRGKQFEETLTPFQRLVFYLHSVFSGNLSNKLHMEKALYDFRHKHYNKFLFENKSPGPEAAKFIQRLKDFEDNTKKPSKSDLTKLYNDLCAFRCEEWEGGHCDGVPVLSHWKPNILQCPELHKKWYKDQVQDVLQSSGLEPNKCAVSGNRYIWKTGPCPAAISIVSEDQELTPEVSSLAKELEKYMVVPRPEILHVSETFAQIYNEMALQPEVPIQEMLHDIYQKRTPEGYDSVNVKAKLREENTRLERALREAEVCADTNNSLYKECSVSLDRISHRLAEVENTLNQYQRALQERDEFIWRAEQSRRGIYNRRY